MVVKLDLAKVVKEGCKEEGLVGLIFNTIGVRYEQRGTSNKCQADADAQLSQKAMP